MSDNSQFHFDSTSLAQQVKPRYDGKGDEWALQHRSALGPTFNMCDIDGFFGQMVFGANSGERLFMEYVPDSFEHRWKSIREFSVVALFDRKASRDLVYKESNRVSLAFYLWICRTIGQIQPMPPRFFIVSGREQPWLMTEICIQSGDIIAGDVTCYGTDWKSIWKAVGLDKLRDELRNWMKRK